jgi:hypothetical protein
MYKDDSDLIWEAYHSSLKEGWKSNLAMMGLGAVAATYPLTHKPNHESKPKHTQIRHSNEERLENRNILEYNKALAKVLKRGDWTEKYYVPVGKNGEPLIDFKTLSKLRKQYNMPEVTEQSFKAAQKTFGR